MLEILNNKSLKAIEKRTQIINAFVENIASFKEVASICKSLNDKQIAIILEAIEEITNKELIQVDADYLLFAEGYILSDDNSCKREASRIIGNLAKRFPDQLNTSIKSLLINTNNESTVVRWGSAYALSRIIVLPQFASTDLFNEISNICDKEQENGVKNQYLKSLIKASKLRG